MSESQVNAYFIDDDLVQNSFSSKDDILLEKVISDPSELIENFSPRFSNKNLSEAVKELIYGEEKEGYPFHYSFALWIVVDAIAERRPKKPHISYPFIDLYDFNESLEENTSYSQLLEIFKSLNNEENNKFPYQLMEWGDVPGFAYISKSELEAMKSEIKSLKSEIKKEKEWTYDIEEPDDVLHILSWLEQASKKKKNLLLVMEGSL